MYVWKEIWTSSEEGKYLVCLVDFFLWSLNSNTLSGNEQNYPHTDDSIECKLVA